MAEWDWNQIGSLAANVLPAVLGAVGGARRGGIGVIPGALQGAGIAAQQNIASEEERAKYQNQLAQQQQTHQLAQQRIDQENRQLEMQSKNYDRMNRIADEQIKNYGLEQQKHKLDIEAATRSVEGQTRFRETLTPNQLVIFDAAPNKQQFIKDYYEDKDWESKVNGASDMLVKSGLDPAKARLLGERGTSHLLGQIEEAKLRPKDRYAMSYHDGMIIKWDKQTGEFTTQNIGGGKSKSASPEKRSQTEAGIRALWKLQQPALAKLYEGDEEATMGAFNKWRTTEEGKITSDFAYGDLTPDEYHGALGSLKRQESQVNEDAMQMMKERYLATDPKNTWYTGNVPQTEEGFQKYFLTKEGKTQFEAYKNAIRRGGPTRAGFTGEAAKDLEYATKNKTSLMGRKNAAQEGATQIPTDPEARHKFIQNYLFSQR